MFKYIVTSDYSIGLSAVSIRMFIREFKNLRLVNHYFSDEVSSLLFSQNMFCLNTILGATTQVIVPLRYVPMIQHLHLNYTASGNDGDIGQIIYAIINCGITLRTFKLSIHEANDAQLTNVKSELTVQGRSGSALLALVVENEIVLVVESKRKDNIMDCTEFEELRLEVSLGHPWAFEDHVWENYDGYIKNIRWTWTKRVQGATVSAGTKDCKSFLGQSVSRIQLAKSHSGRLKRTLKR